MNKSDLLKQLRYGRVVKYIAHTSLDAAGKRGGYGWLSSEITPDEKCQYWFHIKTIKSKYPNIQEALDSDSAEVKKFSFPFWYTIKTQGERTFVDNVWVDWRELPIDSEELVTELISRLQQCQESDKHGFARRLYEIASDLLKKYPVAEVQILVYLDAETLLHTLESQPEIIDTASEILSQTLRELSVQDLVRLYAKARKLKPLILNAMESFLGDASGEDINLILPSLLDADLARYMSDQRIRLLAQQHFSPEKYVTLMERIAAARSAEPDLIRTLVSEIEEFLNGVSEEQLERLWSLMPTFRSMVEIEGYLWQVAPVTIKRERIMNSYPRFFRVVQRIQEIIKNQIVHKQQDIPFDDDDTNLIQNIPFDDDDIDLICTWANPNFARIREQYHRAEVECKGIASRWGVDLEHLADVVTQEYKQLENDEILVKSYEDAKERYESLLPAYQQLLQRYNGDLNRFAVVREIVNADYQTVIEYESAKSEYEQVKQQLELLRERRAPYLSLESSQEADLLQSYETAYNRYEQITPDYEEVLWRWNYNISGIEQVKNLLEQDSQILEEYRLVEERYKELEHSYLQVLAKWGGDIQKLHDRYQIVSADYKWVREYKRCAEEYELCKQNYKEHERECSARRAEKLALAFIRSIMPLAHIEDLSILQVKNSYDDRWKLSDIQVSSCEFSVLIDVKSARMSPNLMYYPELLVPRFKRARGLTRGKNVAICGVAMPAKTNRTGSQSEVELPIVLGFTTIDILTGIRDYYEANGIQFSSSRQDTEGNWLPVWVFDYNSRVYRGLLNLAAELRNLSDEEIPPAHYLSTYFPEVPVAAILVASNRRLPETFENSLKDWQKRLVRKLYSVYRFHTAITLPFIIATLISHFIEQVALEEEFDPSEYLEFLSVYGRPLGVVDPLHVVKNFVTYILKPLWEKRSDLSQYKIYQIHGMRLLRAKRNPSAPWETLVAWCQGCGFYPLVHGSHEHCEECKRLICDNPVPLNRDSEIFYTCSVCQLGITGYSNECPSCRVRVIRSKIDALEATIQRSEGQQQNKLLKRQQQNNLLNLVAKYLRGTLSEVQFLRSSPRMTKQISQLNELGIRILRYANFIIDKLDQQSRQSALEQLIKEAEAVREHAVAMNRLEMIEDITARLKQLK